MTIDLKAIRFEDLMSVASGRFTPKILQHALTEGKSMLDNRKIKQKI